MILLRHVKQAVVLLLASVQVAESEQVCAALGDLMVWAQTVFTHFVSANKFPASFWGHGVEPGTDRKAVSNHPSVATTNEADLLGLFLRWFGGLGCLACLRLGFDVEGDLFLVGAGNVNKWVVVKGASVFSAGDLCHGTGAIFMET